MKLFFLLRTGIAMIFPLLLSKLRTEPANNSFKLVDFSKVLFILFVFNVIRAIALLIFSLNINQYFWLVTIGEFMLTTIFICAVTKYTPNIKLREGLFSIPLAKTNLIQFVMPSVFIFHTCLLIYLSVTMHPDVIIHKQSLVIYLNKIISNPYVFIPLFLVLGFYVAIGEELVFRFFAINALKSIFSNTKSVTIISAIIWTLMHKEFDFNLIIIGVLLGYFYIQTGCLTLCIFMHFFFNVAETSQIFYIYYKNSGEISFSPLQYSIIIFLLFVILYYLILQVGRKCGLQPGSDQ